MNYVAGLYREIVRGSSRMADQTFLLVSNRLFSLSLRFVVKPSYFVVILDQRWFEVHGSDWISVVGR